MSDRERLLAAFETGELVRPSPNSLNVVDLANALASIGGAPNVPHSPGVAAVVDLIGPVDHVVVVMVDGLGLNVVDAAHGADFLADHVAAELTTVFPSSTPTVLTSYATGLWPSAATACRAGIYTWKRSTTSRPSSTTPAEATTRTLGASA